MFNRAVLHLDLDAFFVSVEVLKDSSLRGKPVIVGGQSRRGVVASCSYEARRFGIHSAMPIHMALKLCPNAIVRRGDMDSYSKCSNLITDIIKDRAPAFEKASVDEFYLDLTGMDRYLGAWQWSRELQQTIVKESGLPISMGLSVNKLISKVGVSVDKPQATKLVRPGKERAFLNPLSVRKLPSVGRKTYHKLAFMGVRNIKTLAEIPQDFLYREFGKHGLSLWKKAHAIDDRPVVPYSEAKSIGHERTFQTDTIDVVFLKQYLTKLVTKLGFELRQKGKLTSIITVKLRYTDFDTYTKQRRISYTANDKTLIKQAHELFDQLFERRQLVRLIGVKLSGLVSGHYQVDLFDDTPKDINLLTAMDKIRNRFGANAIMPASIMSC